MEEFHRNTRWEIASWNFVWTFRQFDSIVATHFYFFSPSLSSFLPLYHRLTNPFSYRRQFPVHYYSKALEFCYGPHVSWFKVLSIRDALRLPSERGEREREWEGGRRRKEEETESRIHRDEQRKVDRPHRRASMSIYMCKSSFWSITMALGNLNLLSRSH